MAEPAYNENLRTKYDSLPLNSVVQFLYGGLPLGFNRVGENGVML
jgi:hypothetical protein